MILYGIHGLPYYTSNASSDYKINAVELYERSGETMSSFCKHFEIPRTTLQKWIPLVQDYKKGEIAYIQRGPGQPETLQPLQKEKLKSFSNINYYYYYYYYYYYE